MSSPRYLALTNIRRRSQSLPAATEDKHRPPSTPNRARTIALPCPYRPFRCCIVIPSVDLGLEHGGRTIFRADAPFMTNVQITYTPIADNPRRIAVLIDLVKLEIQYRGLNTERVGSYSVTYMDHDKERQRILTRLRQNCAGAGLLV